MTISKSVLRRWKTQMPLLHKRGFTIEIYSGVNSLYKSYEISYIAWTQIDELMDEKELESFRLWIRGQTTIFQGCYPHDLERFLEGKSSFRF